jgi:hypothetical protein
MSYGNCPTGLDLSRWPPSGRPAEPACCIAATLRWMVSLRMVSSRPSTSCSEQLSEVGGVEEIGG